MKLDRYTKVVLTIIAACLIWSCVEPANTNTNTATNPDSAINLATPVHAQTPEGNRVAVLIYAFGWNKDQNKGRVWYTTNDGQKVDVDVVSAAELAGWAAVLNQKRVFVNQRGWLFAGGAVPEE